MVKRLVDIDDDLLQAARAELGTDTIKATVNESLRRIAAPRRRQVEAALECLGDIEFVDRSDAWR